MQFLSARQAVIETYSYHYGSKWPLVTGPDVVNSRLYCPECHRGPVTAIGQHRVVYPGGSKGPMREHYKCGCGHVTHKPRRRAPERKACASSNEGLRSNDWRIVEGLEAASVMSVIGKLPAHCQAWIRLCYTEEWTDNCQQLVLEWLKHNMEKYPPVKWTGLVAPCKAEKLMGFVIGDAVARERNGRPLYSDAELARRINEDRRQFVGGRFWGIVRDACVVKLEHLTAHSLGPVAALVDEKKNQSVA